MWFLLQKLIALRLLSLKTFYYLGKAIYREGINLMTLLNLAKQLYHKGKAFTIDDTTVCYDTLYNECRQLSIYFAVHCQVKKGQKVGIMARNHLGFIQTLFALSRLGADVYLLNVEMSISQFIGLNEAHRFSFLIYDKEISHLIQSSHYQGKVFSTNDITTVLQKPIFTTNLRQTYESKVVILSSGTTGNFKTAARKPSLFTFLSPFFALITQLNLTINSSIYIAPPLYHGFGLSALIIAICLGAEIHLTPKFEVEKTTKLVHRHQVKIMVVVPLMLYRLMNYEANKLNSLQAIISGGAQLSNRLYQQTTQQLGHCLFSLYGTSEAGFCIMANDVDLSIAPTTIGKPIDGVKASIINENHKPVNKGEIGNLAIKNRWTMLDARNRFVLTGDLAYQDDAGYYYLAGRADDMIVSGGENVYPISLENKLLQHTSIEAVAVIGIKDEEFGQRLKAFVQLKENTVLSENELITWLSKRVARFEMPKSIVFITAMPYNSLGKVNKKALS